MRDDAKTDPVNWPVDVATVRRNALRAGMAMPALRKLQWLEEVQRFAYTVERFRQEFDHKR